MGPQQGVHSQELSQFWSFGAFSPHIAVHLPTPQLTLVSVQFTLSPHLISHDPAPQLSCRPVQGSVSKLEHLSMQA